MGHRTVMQEKYTQKLFFGKYDHRVILKCSSWARQDSQFVHPAVIDYLIKNVEHTGFRMRYSEYYSYYKDEKPSFRTYYFSDPALLTFFQEKLGDHLEEITRPKNKEHSEVLEKERVLVREKLFHGKYRYCIRTSARWIEGTHRSTTKHMNEMVQWCETHFKDRSKEDMYI